jgi:heme-degrading monooxygenase HmoA
MIVRIWRGRADRARADAYPRHFRDHVVPDLRRVPGFLGAHLARRDHGDGIEFTVLTRWASMEAIRAFAGDHVTTAVVEPGAVAALTDYDAQVEHHEVVEAVEAEHPATPEPTA